MSKTLDTLLGSHSLIYKYLLYFATIAAIVFFFPKGGQFKYEFQKGKPWQYENLYAPFDFSIRKSQEELQQEREQLERAQIPYYRFDTEKAREVYAAYQAEFPNFFPRAEFGQRPWNALQAQGPTKLWLPPCPPLP